MNIGGKLQRCTRRFRRIGLSGYRPLTLNAKDGSVTKNTPLDQFLSDTRRQENPQISLWDWAKICNCRKICGADHVPFLLAFLHVQYGLCLKNTRRVN